MSFITWPLLDWIIKGSIQNNLDYLQNVAYRRGRLESHQSASVLMISAQISQIISPTSFSHARNRWEDMKKVEDMSVPEDDTLWSCSVLQLNPSDPWSFEGNLVGFSKRARSHRDRGLFQACGGSIFLRGLKWNVLYFSSLVWIYEIIMVIIVNYSVNAWSFTLVQLVRETCQYCSSNKKRNWDEQG